MPFQKGHPQYGHMRKGQKTKKTLAAEARRVVFDRVVSQMFIDKIKDAKPEYVIDQFMGKAPDKLDLTTKGEKIEGVNLTAELIAIAKQELKKKLLNGYTTEAGK